MKSVETALRLSVLKNEDMNFIENMLSTEHTTYHWGSRC